MVQQVISKEKKIEANKMFTMIYLMIHKKIDIKKIKSRG
jgi:hypothetical protein